MTNKEKFAETFGYAPNEKISVCPSNYDCRSMKCSQCPFNQNWWDKEYKPCFKMQEDEKLPHSNLGIATNTVNKCNEKGATFNEWIVSLLTSMTMSLAQIADKMTEEQNEGTNI